MHLQPSRRSHVRQNEGGQAAARLACRRPSVGDEKVTFVRWGSDEWKWSISIVSAVIRSAGAALTFTCACARAVRSEALGHALQGTRGYCKVLTGFSHRCMRTGSAAAGPIESA